MFTRKLVITTEWIRLSDTINNVNVDLFLFYSSRCKMRCLAEQFVGDHIAGESICSACTL